MHVHVHILSDFEPNEYLYTNHADKGNEKWEIFAWATRDIMAEATNMDKCDLPFIIKQ